MNFRNIPRKQLRTLERWFCCFRASCSDSSSQSSKWEVKLALVLKLTRLLETNKSSFGLKSGDSSSHRQTRARSSTSWVEQSCEAGSSYKVDSGRSIWGVNCWIRRGSFHFLYGCTTTNVYASERSIIYKMAKARGMRTKKNNI